MGKNNFIKLVLLTIVLIMPFRVFSIDTDTNSFILNDLNSNQWRYIGTLHYNYNFTTQNTSFILSPEQKKELKLRITQKGNEIDAAHIDFLALRVGEKELPPDEAADLNNSQNILYKVSKLDNDIVDVTRHTIEATWRDVDSDNVILVMNAREEIIKDLHGAPFKRPINLDLSD